MATSEPPLPKSDPLTPYQLRVLNILTAAYPHAVSLDHIRAMLSAELAPRETVLHLADLQLAKIVIVDGERRWRASKKGVETAKSGG